MIAMVIDDSRAMRMMMGRMLATLGFEVVEAGNGQEGLDQLSAGAQPDVVLVDWHMPVMAGIDFVAAARSAAHGYTGRIVMVTTETEVENIDRALTAGADEYVMKPFDADVLRDKLAMLGLVD